MATSTLHDAVAALANATVALPDVDLDQPFTWGAHHEGVRFALIGTYHELGDLAARAGRARALAGQPGTLAQRLLARYHSGYRDLEALLAGVPDEDYARPPAAGEWPLNAIIAHVVGSERWFFTLVDFALRRARSGEPVPAPLPEGEVERVLGDLGDFGAIARDGAIDDLRAYHGALHDRALAVLATATDVDAATPTVWWEGDPLGVAYRLLRFDAHLRQHVVQVERTLQQLDRPPTEARRLIRLVYGALAEVEGVTLGAGDSEATERDAVAAAIHARAAAVPAAVERGHDLVAAAAGGNAQEIARLVEEDPSVVDARAASGVSAILFATYNGQRETAAALAEKGARIGLHEAVVLGRLDVVEAWVENWPGFADLTTRDGFGPLQLACFFGQPQVALWLADHGADVNAVASNDTRLRPIHGAAAARDVGLVAALLERGAAVDAPQLGGLTALHAAAQNGDIEMIRLLLAHGAEAGATDDAGRTPRDLAASRGHAEAVALLP